MVRVRALALLTAAACAPADPGPRAFVSGGDVYVGVAGNTDRVKVYACDGDPDGAGVAVWFEGEVEDEAFSLESSRGALLNGTFDGVDGVSGTIELPDGGTIDFDGEPAPLDATDRGLFWANGTTADDEPFFAGWILLSADDQRGAIGLSTSGTLFGVQPLPVGSEAMSLAVGAETIDVTVTNAVDAFRN